MHVFLFILLMVPSAWGLTIKVDYRYDSSGFFNNVEARRAIEAVAARWSRILDQPLAAVHSVDDNTDRRFLLRNPATGIDLQISSAASSSTDALRSAGAPAANEYWGGITLPADVWILFVGARSLNSWAVGGALGGGINFNDVFDEPDNLLNRGFNVGQGSLTVLGGSIAFDSSENWHFNQKEIPPVGTVDFYSVALHEVGHCFGMASTGVVEWSSLIIGTKFIGVNAIAALEEDSGSVVTGLPIAGGSPKFDYHWKDGQIESKIFPLGAPNYLSTVGLCQLQEVLMSASAQLGGNVRRRELTNVDVGAVKDLGWSVITTDPVASPLRLGILKNTAGQLVLNFDSESGSVYRVQTSLDSCTWLDVTPSLTGQAGTTIWTAGNPAYNDPNMLSSSGAGGYFRIVKD
ncbi:MAG: matrixin family metalloprotease [Akkermansiaceae bacterium]|jgi:hypothetical protein